MGTSINRSLVLKWIVLIHIISIITAVKAWSQDQSLQQQFNDLKENTETYDKFKVIPETRLNSFWGTVQDSLSEKDQMITELSEEKASLSSNLAKSKKDLSETKIQLAETEELLGTIDFLGMPVAHAVYHSIVWTIIAGLLMFSSIFFVRQKRSGSIISQHQHEYEKLSDEFENHKEKSHQKMLKTKRELQTALNKLHETNVN